MSNRSRRLIQNMNASSVGVPYFNSSELKDDSSDGKSKGNKLNKNNSGDPTSGTGESMSRAHLSKCGSSINKFFTRLIMTRDLKSVTGVRGEPDTVLEEREEEDELFADTKHQSSLALSAQFRCFVTLLILISFLPTFVFHTKMRFEVQGYEFSPKTDQN